MLSNDAGVQGKDLDEIVEAFELAWQAKARPNIADFLGNHGVSRERLLWQLVRVDLECRLRARETARVEEYLQCFAELAGAPDSVIDLIRTEWRQRVQRNETPLLEEYLARFPRYRVELLQMLQAQLTIEAESAETGEFDGAAAPLPENLPARVGRYRLEKEIARGGMGLVVRVRDEQFDRPLAMKVVLKVAGDEDLKERSAREARLTGQMQHPGVPPVQEMGELADGRPYFIMKLVKGRSLQDLLSARSSPAQDLPRFVSIFEQICQTLAYAHARGIIHRDLKPGNIMVGAFGEVQVMDWGLAKLLGAKEPPHKPAEAPPQPISTMFNPNVTPSSAGETVPGSVMGTPAFMAPEQARGEIEQLDPRCDVFGLGGILCAILTGAAPFNAGDNLANHRLAMKGDLTDANARLDACGADAELIQIASQCLAAEPAGRYIDGGKVAQAVVRYQELVRERLREAEVAKARIEEERKRLLVERQKRRVTLMLAGALLVALAGGVAGTTVLTMRAWEQMGRAEKAEWDARANEGLAEDRRKQAVAAELKAKDLVEALNISLDRQTEAQRMLLNNAIMLQAERDKAREEERIGRERLYATNIALAWQAWGKGQVAEVRKLLEQQRPRYDQSDLRGFEWYYLWRLSHAGGQYTIHGHSTNVSSVAFSADGKILASASIDGMVLLSDAATGAPLRTLLPRSDVDVRKALASGRPILAFSPKAPILAVASGSKLTFWNAHDGKMLHAAPDVKKMISCIAFSPDGKWLAAGYGYTGNGAVSLWDVTREPLGPPEQLAGSAATSHPLHVTHALAFAPDSQTLATGGAHGELAFWDLAKKQRRSWVHLKRPIRLLAWAPDGNTLALVQAFDQSTLELRDPTGEHVRAILKGHRGDISALSFAPDSQTLITASEDQTARLWNVATGDLVRTLKGHSLSVAAVAFAPDGKSAATGSSDHSVIAWNIASEPEQIKLPSGASKSQVVAFTPDGSGLFSVGPSRSQYHSVVELIDVRGRRLKTLLHGVSVGIGSAAFSPDGKTLAVGEAGADDPERKLACQLWDVEQRQIRTQLFGHQAPAIAPINFSPDGKTLVTAAYSWNELRPAELRLWDPATGDLRYAFAPMPGSPQFTFTEKNSLVIAKFQRATDASKAAGELLVWDLWAGKEKTRLRGDFARLTALLASPDGKLMAMATGNLDGDGNTAQLKLYDASGKELANLPSHDYIIDSLAFSADGKKLAVGQINGTVRLWDVAARRNYLTLPKQGGLITSLCFYPDNKTLAFSVNSLRPTDFFHGIKLWDTESDKPGPSRSLAAGWKYTFGIVPSPDGKNLVLGTNSGGLKLLEAESLKDSATLRADQHPVLNGGHKDAIACLTVSFDGKILATGSKDRTVKLWNLDAGGQKVGPPYTLPETAAAISCLAFAPDGETLAVGTGGTNQRGELKFWDLTMKQWRAAIPVLPEGAGDVAFSPDGLTVAMVPNVFQAKVPLSLMLIDARTGKTQGAYDRVSGGKGLAFSSDGKTLAYAHGFGIQLLDLSTKKTRAIGGSFVVRSLAYAPDGKTIAAAYTFDRSVKLYHVATGQEMMSWLAPNDVDSVAFSRDGKLLAAATSDVAPGVSQGVAALWSAACDPVEEIASVGDGRTIKRFDERANLVEAVSQDNDGKPKLDPAGVAQVKWKRDDRGRPVEESYHDTEGKPVRSKDGYARRSRVFDDNGLVELVDRGFDPAKGFSGAASKFDERGLLKETTFLDEKDQPTARSDGVVKVKWTHDDRKRIIEISFYDAEGKPVRNRADGAHKEVKAYAGEGEKPVAHTYFDEAGQPMLNKDGYFKKTVSYDAGDNPIDVSFFDIASQPLQTEVFIFKAVPGMPGEKIGLRQGDILVRYGGEQIANSVRFSAARKAELKDTKGKPKELQIMRDGVLLKFEIPRGLLGIEMRDRVPLQMPAPGGPAR